MSFSTSRVTRETQVQESVKILIVSALAARGYLQDTGDVTGWTMVEAFPYGLQKLDTNLVATGYDFDDGGKQFECGSNMKERKYTIESFVFGTTLTWAQALSSAVKFSIEVDQAIPLYDITQSPPALTDEWLELDVVHSSRHVFPNGEPWQQFCYYVMCTVTDWYTPNLT